MGRESERLRAARIKAGYETASAAAEAMGIPVATYIQHENGSRGFPASRAKRYAAFYRVAPEWLLYGTNPDRTGELRRVEIGPRLYVKGAVEAGMWRSAWEFEPDEWEVFVGRADVSSPLKNRFGLRVLGESMNKIYPPGTILECVSFDHESIEIPDNKRVIVQRMRNGEFETTVKELRRDADGVVWLWPQSTSPEHQTPFRVDIPSEGVDSVEITAVVVGSYRPE